MMTLFKEDLVFFRTDELLVFSIMAISSLAASRLYRLTSGSVFKFFRLLL